MEDVLTVTAIVVVMCVHTYYVISFHRVRKENTQLKKILSFMIEENFRLKGITDEKK